MKKSFLITVFLIVFTGLLHAQNMSISAGNVTAIKGDTVLVPVNISNAVNVAAITLKIQFNSSALLWKDAVNWNSQISEAATGADANVLSINWIGLDGVSIPSGKLVDLRFIYNGGQSSLSFLTAQCEVTDVNGNILSVTYTDGSVTPNALSGTPVLLSPSTGTTGMGVSPVLIWNPLSGADTYRIQISTSSNFATTSADQSGISSTSYSASGLLNNTKYYWRINASNAVSTSGWSSVWEFTTVPQTQTVPVLLSPSNGLSGVVTTPTLSWMKLSGATSYEIQISQNANFSSTVIDRSGITDTSFTSSALDNSAQYYWRVNATVSGSPSGWSTVWGFTTVTSAPSAPELDSPSDNAAGVSINPTLTWKASPGASSYRMQISDSQAFSATLTDRSGISGTSSQVTGLSMNSTYYWRVSASNEGGTSAWSAVRSFQTAESLSIKAENKEGFKGDTIKIAITAENFFNVATISMKIIYDTSMVSWISTGNWNDQLNGATSTAEGGKVSLSWFSLTGQDLNNGKIADISFVYKGGNCSLNFDQSQCEITDALGNMLAATYDDGKIVLKTPNIPTQILPLDRITDVDLNPLLAWNAARGAEYYRLQVSTDSLFTIMVFDDSTLKINSAKVGPLEESTKYFWRIYAGNSTGISGYSEVWMFKTKKVTGIGDSKGSLPKYYALGQNYPNPFNPATTVEYQIPKRSHVKLEVYNIKGETVLNLINEEETPGYYKININASNLPSGVYFYRLQAGDYLKTKKFILMK